MKKYIYLNFFFFLFAVSIWGSPLFAAENLSIVLEQKTIEHFAPKTTKGGEGQPETKEKQGAETVIFSNDKFSVRTGDTQRIYDFFMGQLILIDHKKKTYLPTSLYAIPAFKVYEKKNQEVLFIKMQEQTGVKIMDLRPFDLEMMFGADQASGISEQIAENTENNTHSFIYENDEIASYTPSENVIPDDRKDIYSKYFLYEHLLHPVIMKSLLNQGHIFSSLVYKNNTVVPDMVERFYTLSEVKHISGNQFLIPKDYQRIYSSDDKLNEVINASMTKKEMTQNDYKSLMEELLKEQDYMGATIVFFEYTVQYGSDGADNLTPLIQRTFTEAPEESGIKIVAGAISNQPNSREGLEKAIQILEDAKLKNVAHGYVLNVFLANYYDALGKPEKAISLILEALQQNPFLLGAYKDLGDKYLRTFRMQEAWACWNRMREIRPDHMLVSSINGFEQKIKNDFPQYF